VAVTIDEVRHVARLARLGLGPEELEKLTEELSGILRHFEKLREVDVSGVEPAYRVLRRDDVTRPDAVGAMLTPEEAVGNAPDVDGPRFRVPRFLPED
jgi:aspartyl-tRNA(Asn)/glutamyl-tRNA(Gln) amidotransferase subunit C